MSEISFINPAPYGEFKYESVKVVELTSTPNTKIVAPYDGVTIYEQTPDCRNYIKIKHIFDEKVFYSVFCGVENIIAKYNDKVKQGEIIGKFSTDPIKYYIVNEKDSKQPVSYFFTKKTKKDDKKNNDKTTTTTTTLKQFKDDEIPNPFMDMFLSPFTIATNLGKEIKKDVKNIFSKKKKKEDKDEDKIEKEKLTEQINRIKNLMK